MKASKYILFVEEEIKKAEIIQSLKCNQIISLFKPTEIGKGLKQSFPIQRLFKRYNQMKQNPNTSFSIVFSLPKRFITGRFERYCFHFSI